VKITSKVDRESERAVKKMLKEAENVIGATSAEFVAIVSHKTAQRLAHKIQPMGFKKVAAFQASIAKQTFRAMHNAMREGDPSGAESAHQSRRNRRGQVSRQMRTTGQYKRAPYTQQDFVELARKKQKNAGLAKGSWVEAGDEAGIGPVEKVPPIVRRHATSGRGYARIVRQKFKPTTVIGSRITHMRKLISNAKITSALNEGRRNGIKYVERELNKRLKHVEKLQRRAARELQSSMNKFNKRAAREWAKRHKLPRA
jgi:hypothetical protein